MKEEPLDDLGNGCVKCALERGQHAGAFPVPEATKTQPFDMAALKQEWTEHDWDKAEWSEKGAVEEDGDHARTQPSEWRISEEPESSDTTVNTERCTLQGQADPTTERYAAVCARIGQVASARGGSQKECESDGSNTLSLSGKVVSSERRSQVGTHKETCSATSALTDAARRSPMPTAIADGSTVRFSPSENCGAVGPPSLPLAKPDVYTCSVCQGKFPNKKAVRTHKQRRLSSCDICHAICRSACKLEVHRLHHSGELPYRCDSCGRTFLRSNSLRRHLLQHTLVWPHECDVCYKCFASAGHLAQHSVVHTGERPYQCDACGRSFSQSRDWKVHYHVCTGKCAYICHTCGKAFTSDYGLRKHGRVHM